MRIRLIDGLMFKAQVVIEADEVGYAVPLRGG
jgi:hypothetical protein